MIRKKLIEVALPLEAINFSAAAEKQPGIGAHPRGLHLWWARRPLAAARAVIFAQLVDDPASWPELFSTEKKQEKERQRLFKIIEDLVKWENTKNESVLNAAREEIWVSWRRACAENADHPQAKELFDRNVLPAFHDPFAGGGALPLEAQRLGLESYASDLNPVAVLINKAMIEIPPRFVNSPPVNPAAQNNNDLFKQEWKGARGLSEDVRYYGEWIRNEAVKRIGNLYPKVEITEEILKERPDLKPYLGEGLSVIAWLWTRTVKSPNPAFTHVDVPLASTFMLSTKSGKEAYVEPIIEAGNDRFCVRVGKPQNLESVKNGTKLARGANFKCLMSDTPMDSDYIYSEGKAGRIGVRLMAIVAEGKKGRVYLTPNNEQEEIAKKAVPEWKPEDLMPENPRWFSPPAYGLFTYGELFTSRQLVALNTFSDLVTEARIAVKKDAVKSNMADNNIPLRDGGIGALAYAEAVSLYLTFAVNRLADYNSSIATWKPSGEQVMQTFKRQALPMTWDFPESNVLGSASICWKNCVKYSAENLESVAASFSFICQGNVQQLDATSQLLSKRKIVSTDPPYYDNIGYADLSDFFYIWLRRSLKSVFPDLFATLSVPKAEELVATPYRHGGKEKAESFFLSGMTLAMHQLAEQAHPAFPVTIYYAFKQSESDNDQGVTNTGWDTFLAAVIKAGFAISGTWPMRTELSNRMIGAGTNALASSIVLVCRKRIHEAPVITRREYVLILKNELPTALKLLQESNIAPVDMAQAAIGPGMAVYTRFSQVLDAQGNPLTVREALALINEVLDETLAEQEGDFDPDTRFAVSWFDQNGFGEGDFGVAEVLARARVTSVQGLSDAGILRSSRGKVQLLRPEELPADWNPETDERLTIWECVHHLVRALESGGESAAAELLAKLGAKGDIARELSYRLYSICERKKRAKEAISYNALVQSWPEIQRLSKDVINRTPDQGTLFE